MSNQPTPVAPHEERIGIVEKPGATYENLALRQVNNAGVTKRGVRGGKNRKGKKNEHEAEGIAINVESQAIADENAAIIQERREIKELLETNPDDSTILEREAQVKARNTALGHRGDRLGKRRRAWKSGNILATSTSNQSVVPTPQVHQAEQVVEMNVLYQEVQQAVQPGHTSVLNQQIILQQAAKLGCTAPLQPQNQQFYPAAPIHYNDMTQASINTPIPQAQHQLQILDKNLNPQPQLGFKSFHAYGIQFSNPTQLAAWQQSNLPIAEALQFQPQQNLTATNSNKKARMTKTQKQQARRARDNGSVGLRQQPKRQVKERKGGFESPKLTRDITTLLTEEQKRDREIRRQALDAIMHNPLGAILTVEEAEEKNVPAEHIELKVEEQPDLEMGEL